MLPTDRMSAAARAWSSRISPRVSWGSTRSRTIRARRFGHSDVAVTARHYARWVGGMEYRKPMELEPEEIPADLLARLDESPQSPPSKKTAGGAKSLTASRHRGFWGGRGESNPRPPGPQPGALTS